MVRLYSTGHIIAFWKKVRGGGGGVGCRGSGKTRETKVDMSFECYSFLEVSWKFLMTN